MAWVRLSVSSSTETRAVDAKHAMRRTRHVRGDTSCRSETVPGYGDDDDEDDDDDDDDHALSSSRLLLVNVDVQCLVHLIVSSSGAPLLQCLHKLIKLANLLV